jgi:protein DGCR14
MSDGKIEASPATTLPPSAMSNNTPRPALAVATAAAAAVVQTPRSLDRQRVLDEDEYTAALSHVIARDFFPGLVQLEHTNEYLDAIAAHDPIRIHESVRRLAALTTPTPLHAPAHTPYAPGPSDTPRGEPLAKRARYDTTLPLDAFQARYTSEDNASFTHILADENAQRRAQHSWAWAAQARATATKAKALEARERMLLEPPPMAEGMRGTLLMEPPLPRAGLLTASGEEYDEETREEMVEDLREEREVAVVLAKADDDEDGGAPSGVLTKADGEAVDVLARRKDKRSAAVDGWKFKVGYPVWHPHTHIRF